MADYIVTIRNKKGSLNERAYIAIDRADLFKKLAEDGFTAVRVREGVLKKGASRGNLALIRWGVAGVFVILLVVMGFYFSDSFDMTESSMNGKDKAFEMSNVKPTLQEEKKVFSTRKKDTGCAQVGDMSRQERETTVTDNEQDVTNTVLEVTEKENDTRLFKNSMDQLLAMVAPQNVGDSVPPLPIVDNMEFSPEDERKILERLTADDKDSDAILERKELVQSMRDEYQELKKRGWSFIDYVKALEAKAKLDTEIKEESLKIHETVFNDSEISDEEYLKTLEKINKVLKERGIAPINLPENDEESSESDKTFSQPSK